MEGAFEDEIQGKANEQRYGEALICWIILFFLTENNSKLVIARKWGKNSQRENKTKKTL